MKKFEINILSIACVSSVLFFTACSKSETTDESEYPTLIIGKWRGNSLKVNYTDFSGKAQTQNYTFKDFANSDKFEVEFKTDKKYITYSNDTVLFGPTAYVLSGNHLKMGDVNFTINSLSSTKLSMQTRDEPNDTFYLKDTSVPLGIMDNVEYYLDKVD